MNAIHLCRLLTLTLLLNIGQSGHTEIARSNIWCFAWKTVSEPSGGYSVVQTFLRAPLPPGAKLASKEELDKQFEAPPQTHLAVQLETGNDSANGTKLMVKYFRGPIYTSTNGSFPLKISAVSEENWVSAVSTIDNKRIVVGVDNGPIYLSTNSGFTWETINSPGKHSLSITSGDGGCGVSAVQMIETNILTSPLNLTSNWYAVATASDGSGLIISGGISQSPPVLNISVSQNQTILSWRGEVSGYSLQENSDLTTTNWTDVATTPEVVNGYNRVIVPMGKPHQFYRLRK